METTPLINQEKLKEELLLLQTRFNKNPKRHANLEWKPIEEKLLHSQEKLASLVSMEQTGGEPDVVGYDQSSGDYLFFDCSPESPTGRRNLCYDQDALEARKEFKPADSAQKMARDMGITLLTEDEYRHLQELGKFDQKTSSWLLTPEPVRQKGGAIYGDLRYGRVFVYHNGAQSYYAVRGFRGCLRV